MISRGNITRLSAIIRTESLWCYSALGSRISHPIVILKSVHCLQNCRYPSHVGIYLRVAKKLCGQVRIESRLYWCWRIYPQSRIKKDVIQ